MKLSSLKTARATYRFVLGHRGDCLRILWLPVLLSMLLAWLLLPRIATPLLECLHCETSGDATHARLNAVLAALLLVIGLVVLTSIMSAGLWRFILRGEPVTKPYYLSIGEDERRLLVLAALKALLVGVWVLGAALVVGLVLLLVAYLSNPLSPPALALAILASLLALSWLATRLSLSGPATISAQRLSVAASWRATAHNVSRLQRVAALLMLPMSVVVLAMLLVVALFLAWWWAGHAPSVEASAAELARFCASLLRYLWPLALLLLYLLVLLLAALFIVARALEYQALGPPPGAPI